MKPLRLYPITHHGNIPGSYYDLYTEEQDRFKSILRRRLRE